MSSFEAVIERIKQEGQLTRNTGTNSLKAMNKNLEQILQVLNKNFSVLKTNNDAIKSIDKKTPKVSASPEFTTERKGGILAGLSAAITGNTIGRLGIGSTGKAQDVRRASGNFVGKITGREKRQEIAEKLFSLSDSKIKKEKSEETSNEPVVEAVEEQTNILKKIVSLFEKDMFREKQKELKEEDLEDEKRKERKAGVVKEKEKESGGSGIFSELFGSIGSLLKPLLELFAPLLRLLAPLLVLFKNPAVLAGIAALTAAVTLFLNRDKIADLISEFFKYDPERLAANTKRQEQKLAEAKETRTAAEKTVSRLEKEGNVDFRIKQVKGEAEHAENVLEKKVNAKKTAKEIVASLSREEFEEGMSLKHRSKMDRNVFTTGPLKGVDSLQAANAFIELKAAGAFKQAKANGSLVSNSKNASKTGTLGNINVPTKPDMPHQVMKPPTITPDAARMAEASKTQNGQNLTVVAPTNNVSAPVTNSVTNNFDKSVSIGTAQSARMSEFGGMWNSIVPQN